MRGWGGWNCEKVHAGLRTTGSKAQEIGKEILLYLSSEIERKGRRVNYTIAGLSSDIYPP